jgi:tetraacyldisaccharide 4'-kinase
MNADAALRRIASRRGAWRIAGWLLSPLGVLYGSIAMIRRRAWEAGAFRRYRLGVPVVSVGNIEVGGVGKTPVTIWLARKLRERGLSVAVVARDLNRRRGQPRNASLDARSSGGKQPSDEVILLTRQLPDCPVFAGPDKTRAALRAASEARPDVILVDDGFQHLRLCRDIDVVVVDFDHPFGRGGVLPSGTLREFPAVLDRANVFWVNRVGVGRTGEWMGRALGAINWRADVITSRPVPSGLFISGGGRMDTAGLKVLAFCGIGSPEGFRRTLEDAGCAVIDMAEFPDHHEYSSEELRALESRRKSLRADVLVTTEKDAVKLGKAGSDLCIGILRVDLEVGGAWEHLLDEVARLSRESRKQTAGENDSKV